MNRPPELRGVPCRACGAIRSDATFWPGARDEALCLPNADGRDRCRERERIMLWGPGTVAVRGAV